MFINLLYYILQDNVCNKLSKRCKSDGKKVPETYKRQDIEFVSLKPGEVDTTKDTEDTKQFKPFMQNLGDL